MTPKLPLLGTGSEIKGRSNIYSQCPEYIGLVPNCVCPEAKLALKSSQISAELQIGLYIIIPEGRDQILISCMETV